MSQVSEEDTDSFLLDLGLSVHLGESHKTRKVTCCYFVTSSFVLLQ